MIEESRQSAGRSIPEDWHVVALGECCDVRDGTHESPQFHSQGVPFVTSKNIVDGVIDLRDVTFICEEDAIAFNRRSKVDRTDILMAMIGTIGNAVLLDFEPDFCIKNVALIKPRTVDPGYLIQLIRSPVFQHYLDANLEGGIQKFVSLNTLRHLGVSLPALKEQHAIAAALSDVDALVAKLDALIAKKRDIKQAAMQQLLTGRTRLPGFEGEWEHRSFFEIAAPRKERIDPRKSGTQNFCIEMENIEQATGRLIGSTSTSDQSSLKSVFQAKDILFGKLRAYLRKYWLADRLGVCSTEIWVLVADQALATSKFVYQLVMTDRFIELASIAYGTHMPRSDWGVVKNYELALPKLEEQNAIAAVLSDMDAEIAALEARREKTNRLKQGMMQELLTGRIRLL